MEGSPRQDPSCSGQEVCNDYRLSSTRTVGNENEKEQGTPLGYPSLSRTHPPWGIPAPQGGVPCYSFIFPEGETRGLAGSPRNGPSLEPVIACRLTIAGT